ncbi:MAG: hypothetical protein EAZ25_28245 [Oscillatoriales cyanobacterium]|nr:MAG: hypothetical protein EAZ25_28245 [Oscillatoriales cyanobacterium]
MLIIKQQKGYHGWPETGFLRQTSLQCKDLGKNPVSLIVCGRPKTSVSLESPLKRTKEFLIFISAFQSVSTDFRY